MAAPKNLNNDYLRIFLYECHQMTHVLAIQGRSMSKNQQDHVNFKENYQIVSAEIC